nr:RNA 2',3'-cyclic phosphodiesterase [Gammaproteobacteria bacterium]
MIESATDARSASEKRRRLFFALWPPEAQQQAIEATMRPHVEAVRGRAIPARNLHVTLAFLGGVPASRFDAVISCAEAVRGEPFEIAFDQLETWGRARVLCVATSRIPTALARLEEQLRLNLVRERFDIRQQKYRPHVTLARDVRRGDTRAPLVPVRWRVQDFVLAESRPGPSGSEYEVIGRWALG